MRWLALLPWCIVASNLLIFQVHVVDADHKLCPADHYSPAGSENCLPCIKCMPNEIVSSPCSADSDTVCTVCNSCGLQKGHYVQHASSTNVCDGLDSKPSDLAQTCAACRSDAECRSLLGLSAAAGQAAATLYDCYSGETSHDSTVCVDASRYRDPLNFRCAEGSYLDSMDPFRDYIPTLFRGSVYLNGDNTYVADVQVSGTVSIYKTESALSSPMVAVSEASAQGAAKGATSASGVVPVVRIWPEPGSAFLYGVSLVNSSTGTLHNFTFVHPMGSVVRSFPSARFVHGTDRSISSGVWSANSSTFFVSWVDGTISKIVVFPLSSRRVDHAWSPAPPASTGQLMPLWPVVHISAAAFMMGVPGYGGSRGMGVPQCISVPVHSTTTKAGFKDPDRLVQLICLVNFVRDEDVRTGMPAVPIDPAKTFGSYLVRVMASGRRMDVNMRYHTTVHASSGILYDPSFNVAYVSAYRDGSFRGAKHVLKVRLSPSYNYKLELSTSTVAHPQAQTAFSHVLEPTRWQLPGPISRYPLGMSFDSAAVEPLSNALVFYVPTVNGNGELNSFLHFIPIIDPASPPEEGAVQLMDGERDDVQPIWLEDSTRSNYAGNIPFAFSQATSGGEMPRLIFTLYAGLFGRFEYISGIFYEINRCTACPPDKTSPKGSMSIYACRCKDAYYRNPQTGACTPVSTTCGVGQFIAYNASSDSDIGCLDCPSCAPGFYRDPDDCVRNRWRDLGRPPRCIPCTPCAEGYHINTEKCSPSGTSDRLLSDTSSCIKCRTCPALHSIIGTPCSGSSAVDTHQCAQCSSTCPVGTEILPYIKRCTGTSFASTPEQLSAPFDPYEDCRTCSSCPSPGQVRVAGCTGKLINDPPTCVDCMTCDRGHVVVGDCGGTANGHASCEECERCPAGTYLSRRCSGQSLGTPDHSCEPCATCPVDHYVGACTSALQLTVAGDTSSSVEMARPADAGVCIPCKKCPEGSYISKRCSGTGLYDDVECLPCNTGCPQPGTYMHARCSGSTFTPDNDCRPCTPCSLGQYMSSGKCRSGGATNPMDRVCRDCGNCDVGEYKSSLCTGTLTYQEYGCSPCDACREGSYLSKPCDGTALVASSPSRLCTACKTCPRGYYRSGCSDAPGAGTSSSSYDDVACLPCSPCPDGHYISQECTGEGFLPTDRVCTRCEPCARGQYFQQGCTGSETVPLRVCASCEQRCDEGSYILGGCMGNSSNLAAQSNFTCKRCQSCPSWPPQFISVACNGTSFLPTDRTCKACSCPAGCNPISGCTRDGPSDYVCRNSRGDFCLRATPRPTPAPTSPPLISPMQSPAPTPSPTPAAPDPPTPAPTPEEDLEDGKGMQPTLIVGMVFAGIGTVAFISVVSWSLCCR